MEWGTLLVVALIVAGIAGVLLLPMRKQWNADGADDDARPAAIVADDSEE